MTQENGQQQREARPKFHQEYQLLVPKEQLALKVFVVRGQ
jgi:hypothetical protein